jgi:ABC-type Fe3+/spermidine/putrescine transport system ATPase subunit
MSFLKLQNLSKREGNQWLLRDAALEINNGEIFGFLGNSDSGHLAALHLLAGGEPPNSGRILLKDNNIADVSIEQRRFIFVPSAIQKNNIKKRLSTLLGLGDDKGFTPGLTDGKTVFENVAEFQTDVSTEEALNLVSLSAVADTPAKQLSDEQKQRVLIAQALAAAPQILLLDSPFANLEKNMRDRLQNNLRDKLKSLNLTTIIATNDYEQAFALCDRIAFFADGQVLQIGTPRELYNNPSSVKAADFIGLNNLIEVRRLSKSTAAFQEFITIRGEHRIYTDSTEKSSLGSINKNLFLAIRPENLSLTFGAAFPEDNLLKATIKNTYYQGATIRVLLDAGGLELEALVFRLIGLNVGDTCMVGLPPNCFLILKD